MLETLTAYGTLILVLAAWVALSVGSFLNVVIHRLPIMLDRDIRREAQEILELDADATEAEASFNLVVPRSRCPQCETQIRALDNIPLLSWLILRGKCRVCATPISARYPVIEVATMVLTLLPLGVYGFTLFGFAACIFTWMLIAAAMIDYDTMYLPDQITLPLVWLGLLANLLGGLVSLEVAVVGAIVGYLCLWSVYWAFKLITGKEGMGYGDFKLLGAIGAWLGWAVIPGVILIASISGLLYFLINLALGKGARDKPIPFGPFLAIGGYIALVWHEAIATLLLAR